MHLNDRLRKDQALKIDLPRLLETRLLLQANSGAGKSWALRRILEQTAGEVQQIVLDIEGEFSTLREKFDYVVCSPSGGDALAHPKTAKLLARKLREVRVSAIIDIYDLKAHERFMFMRIFLEELIESPKKYWSPALIVIDEAHLFAPEKGKAETTAAVIDLATRGRKRGLSLLAATQRLSKLHKDIAAELLNKIIGRTGLDIDVARAADELGINRREAIQTLRGLKPGEFFCFGPALTTSVEKITIGAVKSKHPRIGERQFYTLPEPSDKIKELLPQLGDIPKESEKELKTINEMKKEISGLRSKLTIAEKKIAKGGVSEVEVKRRIEEAVRKGQLSRINLTPKNSDAETKALKKALGEIHRIAHHAVKPNGEVKPLSTPLKPAAPVEEGEVHLRKGALRILQELSARYPAGYTRAQIATLTRFSSKSGTFSAYLSDLRRGGYIDQRDNLIFCSDEGITRVGDSKPSQPTTHDEVMTLWRGALREGAYKILQLIVGYGVTGVERLVISEMVGMSYTSGTFSAYLSDLVRNGLVTKNGGRYVASEMLFPERKNV